MKLSKAPRRDFSRSGLLSFAALLGLASASQCATFLWDGGGGNGNISTAANWNPDGAPSATGNNLVFAGTTNLTVNNDVITALSTATAGSITFNAGAGAFTISGNAMTAGSGGGGGLVIIQQNSTNNQVISAPINLSGGNGDRSIVFAAGAGSLTLSGNINFSSDWLFPTTTAGTIILSGTNTGDGKATAAVTAGTNVMRAMMRNNVAGTNLVLGSNSALGNTNSGDIIAGTAQFRGIVANQNLNISTDASRNLTGSSLAINTANITFTGNNNLTIGSIMSVAGNRDFVVSGSGQVTVSSGLIMSSDQTGRNLFVNLSGTGGIIVNGKLYDTFHSGGVTTGTSTLRKAGTGLMELNGNSSNYSGSITLEAGTIKLGASNALGNTTGTTTFTSGSTLDLNGQTVAETINGLSGTGVGGNGALINSNTSTGATMTADIVNPANFTIGGAGNITATRIRSAGIFTITKIGAGTITTNGNSHNNLAAWLIQGGDVVLANTSGFGADRGVTLSGGNLKLSGANSDLINDGQTFTINTGTFDLNGKAEAVASIGGTGGVVTNSAAGAATLFVGGGVAGTSSATFAGVIQNGTGVVSLTKEGTGTQTLTAVNTYSGATTINNGTLSLTGTASLTNTPTIKILAGGTLDVSTVTGGFTLGASQTLAGTGNVIGSATINGTLAPGLSPGTLSTNSISLTSGSISSYELDATLTTIGANVNDLTDVTGNLVLDGTLNVAVLNGANLAGGNVYRLFNYTGTLTDNGLSLGTVPVQSGYYALVDTSTSGQVNLQVLPVPEPTAASIAAVSAIGLLARRRRAGQPIA